MFNLQCNGDPRLSFFCGVMFSDTYPRCFATLLANASARFIFWFQRNWKDRTYCPSRAASLVPNPSWVLNSLGTYFFRWRHTWSSNCAIVFQWAFVCLSLWPSYWPASSHGPRCEMTRKIFRTPTAKTWHQPYVHRSVRIRCNFKPTSTCPTPPNPMSTVACTSDATSNQRQHAPPHPTLCPP